MDWDRVRIFHVVANSGSFTKAADRLGLSQSAISRQIGALEEDIGAPLFHRHARGLVLTEQGDILRETAEDVARRMASVQNSLGENRDLPSGKLKVSITVGVGTIWLTGHMAEFLERYPEMKISLIVTDTELDLSMREADVAVRMQRPTQPDLIQRKLMTVHTHIYASRGYLDRHGQVKKIADLDCHRLVAYGQDTDHFAPLNWVLRAGHDGDGQYSPREPVLTINNVYGMLRAVEGGIGLASLPDYLGSRTNDIVRVLPDLEGPHFSAYFIYPEELRNSKRVAIFRDFLLEKVAEQPYW